MTNNKEKKETMEADPQMIRMLELANNTFKITKINVLRKQRKTQKIGKRGKFQENWNL